MKSSRVVAHVALAVVALLAGAGLVAGTSGPASSEAFPGANGKIAYARSDDYWLTSNIWVMDNDGSNHVKLTDSGADRMPMWSPDGTQILFVRMDDQDQGQVWVMAADGSNETQLTFGDGAWSPDWSPDGSQVVYTAMPNPQTGLGSALFVMDADGSNSAQITTDNRFDGAPSWSPDGSRIAIHRQDPDTTASEIWLVDPDGANPLQLTDSGDPDLQSYTPSWSPDGSRIAYWYRDYNTSEDYIEVMDADGSNRDDLFGPGGREPRWSPDGQLIAFARFDDPNGGTWTMAPDGSGLQSVTLGARRAPSWQPVAPPTTSTTTTSTPPSTVATTTNPPAPTANAVALTPSFTG